MEKKSKTSEELHTELQALQQKYNSLSETISPLVAKYQALFENSLDAILLTIPDGRILAANPSACSMFGHSEEEIIKLGRAGLVDVTDPQLKVLLQARKEYGKASGKLTFIRKDGSKFPAELSTSIFRDADGQEMTSMVIRDISQRELDEKALKDSENKLLASKTKLETALESMTDAVFISDSRGHFLDFNEAFAIYHKFRSKEECARTLAEYPRFFDVFTANGELASLEQWAVPRALRGETAINAEYILKRKDTGETWVGSYNFAPIRDSNARIVGSVVTARDITELKKAEKALMESEALFSSTFRASPIPISITDMATEKWIEVNEAFLSVTRYTREEVIGNTFRELNLWKNPGERDNMKEILTREGSVNNFEVEINKKDGKSGTMLIAVEKVDLSGKPILLIMGNEITERKHFETELQFRNILLSTQQEVSIDGILIVDENLRILSFNRKFVDMWGIPADILGQKIDNPVVQFVSIQMPNSRFFQQRVQYIFDHKQETSRDELTLIDGRIIDRYSSPMFSANKEYLGRVIYFRDITERKRVEQELIRAKEKAEESDRLKSAFLANLSHEIRTPMNGILGFARLLSEPRLTGEEQQDFIRIIEKSGERMLNIINDLVDISKIESGQIDVSVSLTNINEQTEYLYAFFKPSVEAKGLQFFVNNGLTIQDSFIETDGNKLYRILTCLIKNSIKYTTTGSIEFGYDKKDGFFEFYVKDTGAGIPGDRQDAVFNRFVQADIADKKALQGAGLGLTIAKAYVELLGGRIWLESEEGLGSVFSFTIPCSKGTARDLTDDKRISHNDKTPVIQNLKI